MADYIDRQTALDALPKPQICEYMDEFGAGRNSAAYDAEKAIKAIPAADVITTTPARWKPIARGEHGYSAGDFMCSACHLPNKCYSLTNFCPNCGARMEKQNSKIAKQGRRR